jgi:hypothetical protein
MRTDDEIKRDVEMELRWDPEIAREAVPALKMQLPYSADKIKL